jgi:hypothetical protein
VEGKALQDGDEIIVGRYRLIFVRVTADSDGDSEVGADPSSMHTIG